MAIYISDTQKEALYMSVLKMFRKKRNEPELENMDNEVVEAAVRYILDVPNGWNFMVHSHAAIFGNITEMHLADAARVLKKRIASRHDLDDTDRDAYKKRIKKVLKYVHDRNLPKNRHRD